MDNPPAHKGRAVRELIEARGTGLLHRPPYSPDLNPVELLSLQAQITARAATPHTVDRRWTVLGQCLDRFTPNQCANDLRHRGYGQAA